MALLVSSPARGAAAAEGPFNLQRMASVYPSSPAASKHSAASKSRSGLGLLRARIWGWFRFRNLFRVSATFWSGLGAARVHDDYGVQANRATKICLGSRFG